MNRLKTAALLVALLSAAAFAQDGGAPVSGNWKVTGDVVGNAVELTCAFTQDGKKLTGSCRRPGSDKADEIAGEVDDKKVTWKFDTSYNGQSITLTFSGALDAPSKLKGGIDVQPYGVSGEFSATKEEAKKEETKKPQP
jgi:type 1 fimbria pilin